jgi:hypothetical protein
LTTGIEQHRGAEPARRSRGYGALLRMNEI